MKYAVLASLSLETPSKRDTMETTIRDFIGHKITWGQTIIAQSVNKEGLPSVNLEIRFQVKDNMDNLFALIKDKIDRIPVLKGTVSKHPCPHDEGQIPCILSEAYTK